MNTYEAAIFTGVPAELLIKMRTRMTSTLRSGPPYRKAMDKKGNVSYTYNKRDLTRWAKLSSCLITAGEAALLLGVTREELINSVQNFVCIAIGPNKGSVLIAPSKNLFMFKPYREKKAA